MNGDVRTIYTLRLERAELDLISRAVDAVVTRIEYDGMSVSGPLA